MTDLTLTVDPLMPPIATLDITPTEAGYIDSGDLALSGGNLYIVINGVEYGSLFFHKNGDGWEIGLGQYAKEVEMWEYVNPINEPTDYSEDEGSTE